MDDCYDFVAFVSKGRKRRARGRVGKRRAILTPTARDTSPETRLSPHPSLGPPWCIRLAALIAPQATGNAGTPPSRSTNASPAREEPASTVSTRAST
ncbi:hypothetical protein ColLi_03160 [Colletotrichum liriopes]|uniref:Uncharacterized protein n=1 Tax=Colletotrichum liriopes TaxID=708192 RepID=A0AA37LQD7_9PEZI|nr:hypothetical protein ColLi_03160 [Colletotrichum liriopes]